MVHGRGRQCFDRVCGTELEQASATYVLLGHVVRVQDVPKLNKREQS